MGAETPDGAIEIAEHEDGERLTHAVKVMARVSYSGELLVPGIPEASSNREKLKALSFFCNEVKKRLNVKNKGVCDE